VILQAYLDVLEEEGKSELVAVYAASLGEQNGAESYARFLKAMDPRATKEERRVALLRAKEHGLDLVEVAKLTVNMVMNDTFMVSARSLSQLVICFNAETKVMSRFFR
jgi:nuclear pore complex protein Nup107